MSYADVKRKIHQSEDAGKPMGPALCKAYGCNRVGTIAFDSSTFMCSTHAFVAADKWQETTALLHQHEWLTDFIESLMRMRTNHQPWRQFAIDFWAADPPGAPDPREESTAYEYRMRLELDWRCKVSAHRPRPRIPRHLMTADELEKLTRK